MSATFPAALAAAIISTLTLLWTAIAFWLNRVHVKGLAGHTHWAEHFKAAEAQLADRGSTINACSIRELANPAESKDAGEDDILIVAAILNEATEA